MVNETVVNPESQHRKMAKIPGILSQTAGILASKTTVKYNRGFLLTIIVAARSDRNNALSLHINRI
jgi:hypothetical protein